MGVQHVGEFLWQALPEGNEKRQAYYCSREWGLKKSAIKNRSAGVCERCRTYAAENVHHKTYKRLYREVLSDLWHLCRQCHEFLHGNGDFDPIEEMAAKRLRPRSITAMLEPNNQWHSDDLVVCPSEGCKCENCHVSEPAWESESQRGNQGLCIVPMECERGHTWDVVFFGHKGTLSCVSENIVEHEMDNEGNYV